MKCRLASHTVRYIDDLLTRNNPYFIEEISNIYPVEQTTESETLSVR